MAPSRSLCSIAAWTHPAPFAPPGDRSFRRANIMREGTRMSAEVFAPKASAVKKLPAILMAHGWGGTTALLRPDAIAFAPASYLAGAWSDRDARVILTAPEPREHANGEFTAEVQEVREVVDPIDIAHDRGYRITLPFRQSQTAWRTAALCSHPPPAR